MSGNKSRGRGFWVHETEGDDEMGDGSPQKPYRTHGRAWQAVMEDGETREGDFIIVIGDNDRGRNHAG